MILKRWDYNTHTYKDFEVPDDRDVATFKSDFQDFVDCAACGKRLVYGETYTSMEIHTRMGFGYCVCPACHEKEWKRRIANDEK